MCFQVPYLEEQIFRKEKRYNDAEDREGFKIKPEGTFKINFHWKF